MCSPTISLLQHSILTVALLSIAIGIFEAAVISLILLYFCAPRNLCTQWKRVSNCFWLSILENINVKSQLYLHFIVWFVVSVLMNFGLLDKLLVRMGIPLFLHLDSWSISTSFRNFCLMRCPGFSWDRVNCHKKLAGLTQTSQSNGIFCTMWCHAEYLSTELAQYLSGELFGDFCCLGKLSIGWWEHCKLYILIISIIDCYCLFPLPFC